MEKCIVCGTEQFRKIYADTLKVCAHCGFATANMEIGTELLNKTYSAGYFSGDEYFNYLQDKEILQLNFEKRIRYIKRNMAVLPEVGNTLEIGCAYGFFGELVKKHWDVPYKGVDVVPDAVAYGRESLNLDLVTGDYLTMRPPDQQYTDIFMWDVIEHLLHPEKFIKKAHGELAGGGRIYITTGDFSSFLSRLQGRRWRMIHPPSHIHYFSKHNLARLLANYGFQMVRARYIPVYRSVKQIYYSMFVLNKSAGILRRLLSLIPPGWNIPLNTRDILLVIAVKDNHDTQGPILHDAAPAADNHR